MMAAGLAALTLSGCASNDPAPLEQMRLTEQALEQAKAVGATDDVAELKLAQDKYAAAQIAMTAESYKKARLLAEQAELDARLAESKVLTQKSKDQLGELDKSLKRLRKQLGRPTDAGQSDSLRHPAGLRSWLAAPTTSSANSRWPRRRASSTRSRKIPTCSARRPRM